MLRCHRRRHSITIAPPRRPGMCFGNPLGGDDHRHQPDRSQGATVGARAATSVVVVNGKTDHSGDAEHVAGMSLCFRAACDDLERNAFASPKRVLALGGAMSSLKEVTLRIPSAAAQGGVPVLIMVVPVIAERPNCDIAQRRAR